MTKSTISQYTEHFQNYPRLMSCLEYVLGSLPEEIKSELLSDPNFKVALDDYRPGQGRFVLMPNLGPGGGSRCVVLKPRLEKCSDKFSKYIIAHELAHAFLYNRGWKEISDPEEAADALAAHWGYEKVPFEFV
ncbi:MAG: hypothetical protein AAGA30_11645 [Planctomycetota bacterium]